MYATIIERMCRAHHLVRAKQGYTTAAWEDLQERNREEYRAAMRDAIGAGFVRLTKQGERRVLDGRAGMIFPVEGRCGIDYRCVSVIDYRYPTNFGYQYWTLGLGDFEEIG